MNPERVVIESGRGRSKLDLLNRALDEARFEDVLEHVQTRSGKTRDEFLVVVKPNLAMYFGDPLTITDPELVEHIVDRIHDAGYSRVVVAEAQNSFVRWLENRDVERIAREAGYRFRTPKGRLYDLVDLSRNARVCTFREEFSLCGVPISETWQKADFRLSFAKNKTHEQYVYTLCLKNLLGAVSAADKHLHCHTRLKVWDVCLEMYRQFPVHFNVIDAYTSSHGNSGAQAGNPLPTRTIIAGTNTLLVDWAGAIKMGVDPYLSPLHRKALEEIGLPEDYEIIGDSLPYPGWKNVHPLIAESYFRLEEADRLRNVMWPASFTNDPARFPWRTWLSRAINRTVFLWSWTDRSRVVEWLYIGALWGLVLLYGIGRAFRKAFLKRSLYRKVLPLSLYREQVRAEEFEELPRFIRPLEEIAAGLPRHQGVCHTFVDQGILFGLERELDIPFEDFVTKMDIGRAIQGMKDFFGGNRVQVKQDDRGRCIHQIERTVFLPQPNLLAFFGARDIDVTKIERISYGEGERKIIWKTVRSDNATARFDEGAVTFERSGCRTRVRILAHQDFPLPPVLRWIHWRFFPGLRRRILLAFYLRYFEKTLDNYRASAEGEDEPIGRAWVEAEAELREAGRPS